MKQENPDMVFNIVLTPLSDVGARLEEKKKRKKERKITLCADNAASTCRRHSSFLSSDLKLIVWVHSVKLMDWIDSQQRLHQ